MLAPFRRLTSWRWDSRWWSPTLGPHHETRPTLAAPRSRSGLRNGLHLGTGLSSGSSGAESSMPGSVTTGRPRGPQLSRSADSIGFDLPLGSLGRSPGWDRRESHRFQTNEVLVDRTMTFGSWRRVQASLFAVHRSGWQRQDGPHSRQRNLVVNVPTAKPSYLNYSVEGSIPARSSLNLTFPSYTALRCVESRDQRMTRRAATLGR
jgi:hypothetical protein